MNKLKQMDKIVKNTNVIDCQNATAPVNISKDTITGPCVLKCDYNHKYGIYTPNITNKKQYLSLNYSGKANPVKYNNENYNVQEVRIYQPSLHKYNGAKSDGEIMIIHNGPGKNLIVSVPFIAGSKTDMGSSQLNTLIEEAASRTPNVDESVTSSSGDFSLDNFIPKKKGFFAYTGTLAYQPCNGSYSYVVYNLGDGLNINPNILNNLRKITFSNIVEMRDNSVFFNKKGANADGLGDSNIYIDCQPVNEEGQILVQEGSTSSSSNGNLEPIDVEKLMPFVYIFIGIGVAYGIIYSARKLFKKLKNE